MITKFKDFINISFVRDVGVLQIGKFFTVFLAIANSVILARLLRPELYGIYGLVFAFVGLIALFMDWGGRYASLTLLAEAYVRKDKQEIKNILTYFVKINILAIVFVGILGVVLAPFLAEQLYHNNQIGQWAKIILLAGFLTVVYNMLNISLQAMRKIKQLAILEVFNKFIYFLIPVLLVLAGWGLAGIVWGYFISAFFFLFLTILIYSFLIKKDVLLPGFKQIFDNFKKINFKKYFNFGFLIAVDKNLGQLVAFLPIIFLGVFALPQEIGYFKIAFGYITIPSMMLEPISRLLAVQLPKSKTYGWRVLKQHFFKTAFYSGLISFLLLIPFVILAPYLVRLFYGEEYIQSIRLVYYLSVMTFVSGFGVGLSSFYRTVNKMKISIIISALKTILIVLLIFVLIRICTPLMAVIWSLIISACLSLVVNFYIIKNIFEEKYEKN